MSMKTLRLANAGFAGDKAFVRSSILNGSTFGHFHSIARTLRCSISMPGFSFFRNSSAE